MNVDTDNANLLKYCRRENAPKLNYFQRMSFIGILKNLLWELFPTADVGSQGQWWSYY